MEQNSERPSMHRADGVHQNMSQSINRGMMFAPDQRHPGMHNDPRLLNPAFRVAGAAPMLYSHNSRPSEQFMQPSQLSISQILSQLPPDVQQAVSQGAKPVVFRRFLDDSVGQPSYFAARVPVDKPLDVLQPPVTLQVQRNDEATPTVGMRSGWGFGRPASAQELKRKVEPPTLRIQDSANHSWNGKFDGPVSSADSNQAHSSQFVMIDKGTHVELLPFKGWVSLTREVQAEEDLEDVDNIERKRKLESLKEHLAESRMNALLNTKRRREDDNDSLKVAGVTLNSFVTEDESTLDLKTQQRRKLSRAIRKKRLAGEKDVHDIAASSTSFGEIRKAAVDWDFEEGDATDDEGGGSSDEDRDVADVEDSEEEDQVLTGFGEQVTQLLQNQRENEDEEDLAQFSDNDDVDSEGEDEEGGPASSTQPPPTDEGALGHKPPPTTEAPLSRDSVRSEMIRIFNSQGNRIPARLFMEKIGLSQKDSKFLMVKELLKEMAEIRNAPDGQRLLVLKTGYS